ncbi:MAG: pknB [Thermoleophilia bacterium]|jgi:hypothetical protein|nr:pknB [Thermoleophilia bacterium]
MDPAGRHDDATRVAGSSLPDRYADPQLIARGGMGEVWRARDTVLGRLVAIKTLRLGSGTEPRATVAARFQREARAVASLSSHRSVVTIYDVGETNDGVPLMTMQWLEGGTLAQVRAPEPDEVVRWMGQVADALDAAHRAGIVHRDVKPGNVLLDEHRDAHIGDFGIASIADQSDHLTLTGAVVGTATYMAPEQARGESADARSDQYALAAMAFELLAGRRPFQREAPLAEALAALSEPVPSASWLAPRLGDQVDAVFAHALAKVPADRYASCSAFVAALGAALDAPALPTTEEVPAIVAAPHPRVMRAPRADRPRRAGMRRRVGLRQLLAGAAVLGCLALLALFLRDPAPSQEPDSGPTNPGATTRTEPDEADQPTDATPTATEPEAPAETTTAPARAPEQPAPEQPAATDEPARTPDGAPLSRAGAVALHEQAFTRLQQRRYAEALPMAQRALAALGGVSPYEAFANYNVGASLAGLGRCSEALRYLDRSEQLQGSRGEIDAVRAGCRGR